MIALLCWALLAAPPGQATRSIDVVLLVDVSHSVTYGIVKRDRTLVHDAGWALASAIAPGDAVRLGTFGDAIVLDSARLADAAALRAKADALGETIGGASPIWDALAAAVDALSDGIGARGVIVVTDGRSTGNRRGFTETLDRLQASRVPVFVVSLDARETPQPDPGARLRQLASATGGTCVFVERGAVGAAIARAANKLRAGIAASAR